MIDHGGGGGGGVSTSISNNNHGDVGSSNSNSSHRGVGGDDKHVVVTAASSSSSDSQAQLLPQQGSTTHTFDRDAALVALRRLGADMDERFVEQQQLLRIAYEHLCIQIEQLRCRVPYVTMTASAGAAAVGSLAPAGVNIADCLTPQKNDNSNNNHHHDGSDNDFAMMTVNALLRDTQQPHSDTKRSGLRDNALLGDVAGGVTTTTATLMGTPAAAVGSQRYHHHGSQPRDDKHNDDKDNNNNGNDTLAPAGTLGSIGDSGTAAVGPLSATRSHPFLSVFDDMTTTTTTTTTLGDSEEGTVGTHSTYVRKDDVASSLAADLATAAVAAVVGDDEDDEDEQQRQRRQQQRNDATTTAMTTAATADATPLRAHGSDAYAYAAAMRSPQTHATTDATAPPLHPRSASGSGYAAAATHDGGPWHALSSTSPARHGNTAAAAATTTAPDAFTASPQALSKLSIDVLSCFGQQQGNNNSNNTLAGHVTEGNSNNYPHHAIGGSSGGGVHLSFEKLYTQLTSPTGAGVQADSGRLTDALYNDARFATLPVPGSNSNSSVNSSNNNNNNNNNNTTATVASSSAATAAAAAAMLGASPSSLPPPPHAQMTQQQQQQVSPAARHARAHDIIPIDSLRTLHDQHLTTTIKAVYEHGRPVVVPTPGGAPVDVAALGIDVRSSCQVLVEFKRERVLQYDSVAFVAPGSYVMVGGDRGEDLGLVIYTWCEVSHKPRNHQNNNNNNNSNNSSSNGATDAAVYSKGSSNNNNDGNTKVAGLGDASSSGNAHVDAAATTAAISSALPADYAHQRSAVVGIGLTGSRLRRSIGVGNGTVLRLASDADVRQLHTTQAELERRAIDVCGQRVLEHALPMVIVDAEYQYDKNKLTFFYEAQQRLDFRELVRDLFKTFRARIWMEPLEV